MKNFKMMMMTVCAAVSMMTASAKTVTANEDTWRMVSSDAPVAMSDMGAPASALLQYDYVNEKNETRRFIYSINKDGRVTDRMMYGWDNEQKTWTPISLIHAQYGHKTHKVTHALWNPKTRHFEHRETESFRAADFNGSMIHLPQFAHK